MRCDRKGQDLSGNFKGTGRVRFNSPGTFLLLGLCIYLTCLTMQETLETPFDPWVGKIPWRRKWQSTPVFLPGNSHGQRSLAGYSLWRCKELDTTYQLNSNSQWLGLHTSTARASGSASGQGNKICGSPPPKKST